jgi:hypothetical protein
VESDAQIQQRRLIIVLAINGVCSLTALAGIIGSMGYGVAWMNWLFLGSLLVGFGSQCWLIIGFLKGKKQP